MKFIEIIVSRRVAGFAWSVGWLFGRSVGGRFAAGRGVACAMGGAVAFR